MMSPTAEELSNTPDPAWPTVLALVSKSQLEIEVLSADPNRADRELEALQVTTRSCLGALAHHCGGILVDHGWLRILGGGCEQFPLSITGLTNAMNWVRDDGPPTAVAVGIDVLGGLFAINGGGISPRSLSNVHYFDPAALDWIALDVGHGQWVASMFEASRLTKFYEDLRWPGWEKEVETVPATHGIGIYPPLWTGESRPIIKASRKPVPLPELVRFNFEYARQLGPR